MYENVNADSKMNQAVEELLQNKQNNNPVQKEVGNNSNLSEVSSNDSANNVQNNELNEKVQELILGKFKSVDDLVDAYKNIQKQQGAQSEELGNLRKTAEFLSNLTELYNMNAGHNQNKFDYIVNNLSKYDTDKFMRNPEFKNLYTEAFNALGTDLDTEKFVDLVDKYVESRILAQAAIKAAEKENESLTDGMQFSSGKYKKAEKKLRMQDIPPEELESYIAKYI
ncbi:MAG: hypothetical protein NC200_07985 [Candidatus Gastranaerophilales bacterium]|nr:hypothetical protein [Candidatus Gastranaerophilales bacterium]